MSDNKNTYCTLSYLRRFLFVFAVLNTVSATAGGNIPLLFFPLPPISGAGSVCSDPPVTTQKGTASTKTSGLTSWTALTNISLNAGDSLMACISSADELIGWKKMGQNNSAYNLNCAIKTDDTLWCWGFNAQGQVGNGTINTAITPELVAGGSKWIASTSGGTHSCGIKSDGTAWCWGADNQGWLGDDTTLADKSSPSIVAGGSTWTAIAGGYDSTCGIKSDGTAWCWGRETNGTYVGLLGNGGTTTNRPTPVQVSCSGCTWKAITAGKYHTCAIKSDDSLWCWGNNTSGQIGNGGTSSGVSTPIAVSGGYTWKSVAASDNSTCGIRSDDTAWCWGGDSNGELGDDSTLANKTAPVQVAGGSTWKWLASNNISFFGKKMDDSLWAWGGDNYGSLGDDAALQNKPTPVSVAGGGIWSSVTGGGNGTVCGIKSDKTLWYWGAGSDGSSGNGVLNNPFTPTPLRNNYGNAAIWNGFYLTKIAEIPTASGNAYIYSLPNATAGTGNFSLNFNLTTATGHAVALTSVNRLDSSSMDTFLDKTSSASGLSSSPSSGSVTTANTAEFLYGCISTAGPSTDSAGTWSNGFTDGQRVGTSGGSDMTASEGYKTVNATGSYSAAKSGTTSSNWQALIATLNITPPAPNAFTFTNQVDVVTNTPIQSNIVQITGAAGCSFSISISGGSAQYRICSDSTCSVNPGAWTSTAGTVNVNEYVQLQMTSGTYLATVSTNLTVKNTTVPWSITGAPSAIKTVFITAATWNGNLGGIAGADAKCAAILAGSKAWISDTVSTNAPAYRFTGVNGTFRYKLTNGSVIADGWAELTSVSQTIRVPIDRDENGVQVSGANNVWTNVTAYQGATSGTTSNTNTCTAWSSSLSARSATVGSSNVANANWSSSTTAACNTVNHLYCFEQ